MRIPDRLILFLLCFFSGISISLLAQSADIGLISVDSIVKNSQIGDSSKSYIGRLLLEEQKIFRDSFEHFEREYAQLRMLIEKDGKTPGSLKPKVETVQQMNQRLACMEHLATSIELLYEEEFRYFVSEELRRHTPQVKNRAQVSLIVTHKPPYTASENEQEEFSLLSLNQLFIEVVQNSLGFRQRWAGFKQQMTVKIAALKLNMHQHCFNN